MSFRRALTRKTQSLQPEYVRTPVGGRDAVFRFSVPVLRVVDVAETVAWYTRHLGFVAESFPDHSPYEFAIIERDAVQILIRRAENAGRMADGHSGWDLYLWVDGADLSRLESAMALAGRIVRPLSTLGSTMAELEVRDPNGYVLCIGGPNHVTTAQG
jgi:catechol 2,3-dioxygenase-like lactoylglutathione lyase family enzyme